MDKAIIYARVANGNDQLSAQYTIFGQKEKCREYAKKNRYEIVGEYFDVSPSGKQHNFQRLVDIAKSGDFQAIIVCRCDRVSRSMAEFYAYKQKLAKYGVKLISVTDTADESIVDLLMKYKGAK